MVLELHFNMEHTIIAAWPIGSMEGRRMEEQETGMLVEGYLFKTQYSFILEGGNRRQRGSKVRGIN